MIILSFFSINMSHAEWVHAKIQGAKNDIWINTESDALYVGQDCKPLMSLRHLRGRKPRNLSQRKQDFLWIQKSNLLKASKNNQGKLDKTSLKKPNNPLPKLDVFTMANIPFDKISPDSLNLSYRTQPTFDPLHRNNFNVSINDNMITLTSKDATIKARINGRYEYRARCGL